MKLIYATSGARVVTGDTVVLNNIKYKVARITPPESLANASTARIDLERESGWKTSLCGILGMIWMPGA